MLYSKYKHTRSVIFYHFLNNFYFLATQDTVYCIYDLETVVVNSKHYCNLAVCRFICTFCLTYGSGDSRCLCERLGRTDHIFKNFDGLANPIKQFIELISTQHNKINKHSIICLAHNSSKFDSHLVQEALIKMGITPRVVMKGLQIYRFFKK